MTISRRVFLAALLGGATTGVLAADEDFFKNLIGEIKDRKERDFFERHRDDARWDGKYYYDREDNRRYTRDEWRKEMRWRYNEEKAGRNWRNERYRRKKDDDKRKPPRKDDRRDNKRRNDKRIDDRRRDDKRRDPRHW